MAIRCLDSSANACIFNSNSCLLRSLLAFSKSKRRPSMSIFAFATVTMAFMNSLAASPRRFLPLSFADFSGLNPGLASSISMSFKIGSELLVEAEATRIISSRGSISEETSLNSVIAPCGVCTVEFSNPSRLRVSLTYLTPDSFYKMVHKAVKALKKVRQCGGSPRIVL